MSSNHRTSPGCAPHLVATPHLRPAALQTVLEDVFDPDSDRIVHAASPRTGDTDRPVTGGLAAALGFIGARQRLNEDHWVVYVAGRSELSSIVAQLDHWNAFRLDRFMIVMSAQSASRASVHDAARRGLPVVDMTSRSDSFELRSALEQARRRNTAFVALVDPDFCDGDSCDARPCDAPARDPVLDGLVTAVVRDPRITPVLMCSDPGWNSLVELLPASLLRVAPQDIEEAVPWCLALAAGGCHPVLIFNGREIEHRRRLAEQLRRDPQPVTLIVDDRHSRCDQIYELADGSVSFDGDFMPGIPWVHPQCVEQARAILQETLALRMPLALRLRAPLAVHGSRPDGADPSPHRRDGRSGIGERDQAAIAKKELSPDVLSWVREYERLSHRGRYLWRWCLHGLELTTLSSVSRNFRPHACDSKLLAVMYGVLLDDVADREHDGALLQWLIRATLDGGPRDFDQLPPGRRQYADFTCRVWDCYRDRIRQYPRYGEFARILEYDSQRVVNTMRYALLVNSDVRVINRAEHDLYTPHNMQMMTFAMVDLMASPGFDVAELGPLRQAVWHAQCMGRIGNLVSTWERELDEGDFSSGVFSRLVDAGEVSVAALPHTDDETIRKAVRSRGIECSFLDEWAEHRRQLRAMIQEVGSVDLNRIVTALERLIRMELFSRGLK